MANAAALEFQVNRDEVQVQRGDVALCFLINRSTRSMRVIDFRAGYQPLKAELVHEVAAQQGIDRVFTVVEREEATTWNRMGFEKEGNIPGFYKRSDAYVLGLAVEKREALESGTRIRVKAPSAQEAQIDRAERAYQAARRFSRSRAPEQLPRVKVLEARPQDADKAFEAAIRTGRDLSRFERFGRGGVRRSYLCTARGGFSLLVGVEVQPCFDNVLIELLVAPRGDKETWLTVSGLEQVAELLKKDGLVSAFAISPVDSVELMAALVAAGFRRTGRLADHLIVRDARADAFLWSRKLAEPE